MRMAESTMKVTVRKPGDHVTIYCDPITEKHPEGAAVLVQQLDADMGTQEGRTMERWRVKFVGEPGYFDRFILTPQTEASKQEITYKFLDACRSDDDDDHRDCAGELRENDRVVKCSCECHNHADSTEDPMDRFEP